MKPSFAGVTAVYASPEVRSRTARSCCQTTTILQWIADSQLSPTAVMVVIVLVYPLLGAFMDPAAIIILTAPTTTALMVGLGRDPVWWA
jgi:TRAP-type C4-dicarboxylate transport system permease large subunit